MKPRDKVRDRETGRTGAIGRGFGIKINLGTGGGTEPTLPVVWDGVRFQEPWPVRLLEVAP